MDKGYYIKLFYLQYLLFLSQSTIKMDKGYYKYLGYDKIKEYDCRNPQ